MCQTCGCTPCVTCGRDIEEGVCCGCELPSNKCTCDLLDEEDEDELDEDSDDDLDEDDDEDEDDFDDDDDEDDDDEGDEED